MATSKMEPMLPSPCCLDVFDVLDVVVLASDGVLRVPLLARVGSLLPACPLVRTIVVVATFVCYTKLKLVFAKVIS